MAVASLLTFCPPAPCARIALISISCSGIVTCWEIWSMVVYFFLRRRADLSHRRAHGDDRCHRLHRNPVMRRGARILILCVQRRSHEHSNGPGIFVGRHPLRAAARAHSAMDGRRGATREPGQRRRCELAARTRRDLFHPAYGLSGLAQCSDAVLCRWTLAADVSLYSICYAREPSAISSATPTGDCSRAWRRPAAAPCPPRRRDDRSPQNRGDRYWDRAA